MNFNLGRDMRVLLVLLPMLFAACNKDASSGANNKTMAEELMATSKPFNVEVIFNGEEVSSAGFFGKISMSAQAKNNTKHTFDRSVGIFVMLKDGDGILKDKSGVPIGGYLSTRQKWLPGDTISFSAKDLTSHDGGEFIRLLTAKVKTQYNKPINIDAYVTSKYFFQD